MSEWLDLTDGLRGTSGACVIVGFFAGPWVSHMWGPAGDRPQELIVADAVDILWTATQQQKLRKAVV